jgi:gluconolactonase
MSRYAYDVLEKRNAKWLVNRRVFAMPDCGVPDGIKCDAAGNVYAGCGDGLNVWNSAGTLLGKVLIPGGITNFCFGKSGELFLLNETRFWILKVAETVKGALLVRMGLHVDPPDAEGESSDDDESMTSLFGDGA